MIDTIRYIAAIVKTAFSCNTIVNTTRLWGEAAVICIQLK